jgi:hypothetical protein
MMFGYTYWQVHCLTVPNQISIEQSETRACGEGHVVGQAST